MVYLNTLGAVIKMAEALLENGYAIHVKQVSRNKYELRYDIRQSVIKE